MNKVKLLLEYFKNIIDENGNIIFPPNINKNFLDVSNVFLTVSAPIHNNEDLDMYRIFINTLNIPKSLIKNKFILDRIGHNQTVSHVGGKLNINNYITKPKKKKKTTSTYSKHGNHIRTKYIYKTRFHMYISLFALSDDAPAYLKVRTSSFILFHPPLV